MREFEVGVNGIAFRLGKQQFAYFDEDLSALRGRRVLAWFDPERPDLLAVTALDRKNPILMHRSHPVDFLAGHAPHDSAEAAHYRAELSKQHGFNAHPKARFKALKATFEPTFRQVIPDRQTAALAVALTTQRKEAVALRDDDSRRHDRILRLCRETGTPPETLRDFSEETEQSLRRRAQRRRESAKAEARDPDTV